MAVEKAARMYGVPSQTLRDRVCGCVDVNKCNIGVETILSLEEEERLVQHVETMGELGYGFSNVRLQHLAGELAFDLGRKKNNKPMSNNWLYGFLKRWQVRISSMHPRKLESNRAKSTTPEAVESYYENCLTNSIRGEWVNKQTTARV
jgi:hypothetical protein